MLVYRTRHSFPACGLEKTQMIFWKKIQIVFGTLSLFVFAILVK